MNDDEIKTLMATEVMGAESKSTGGWQWTFKDGSQMDRDNWTPTTDMNQAMECVDKSNLPMTISMVGNYTVNYWCGESDKYKPVLADNLKDLPNAICKAILKAKGLDK